MGFYGDQNLTTVKCEFMKCKKKENRLLADFPFFVPSILTFLTSSLLLLRMSALDRKE